MSTVRTLKRNVENFFREIGVNHGYSSQEMDELFADIIYEDLYDAVLNQLRSVFEHIEFEPYGDMLNCCVQDKRIFDGTLLTRVLAYENDNDDYGGMASRRYLEIWVDEDMELQVVSCFESTCGCGNYVTQYREIQDLTELDEISFEIEDAFITLAEMCWRISANDAIEIYEEWE